MKLLFQAGWGRSFWLQVQLPAELASALCYHNSSLYSHWLGSCSSNQVSCCYWKEQNAAIRIIIRSGRELQFVLWVTTENESVGFLSLVIYCRYCICFDILCEFWVKRPEILLALTAFWCSFWMRAVELSCCQEDTVTVSGFSVSYWAYLWCNQFTEH